MSTRRPADGRRPPTLASLAAELGISRTAVSNAYNRPDQLSPELRQRVLDTARRLGYPGPDPLARSLRTRRVGAVGLLLAETLSYAFRDPGAVGFLEGLSLSCEQADQGLLLLPAGPQDGQVSTAVQGAGVDGFVVYSAPEDDAALAAVRQRGLPMVVCDQPRLDGVDFVGIDDHGAARAVATHLIELGHRRVGVVCMRLGHDQRDGPAEPARQRAAAYHVQRDRLAGLAEAFGTVLPGWSSVPVVERAEHTAEAGASAAADLLDRHGDLTGLICTSDVLALGVLGEVRRRGKRIPEDVSITGFDGLPDAVRAGLTTVSQPVQHKGRVAGQMLLEPAKRDPHAVCLPAELVVGATSGPPRAAERPGSTGGGGS